LLAVFGVRNICGHDHLILTGWNFSLIIENAVVQQAFAAE
jgi:hypothetical protein